MKRNPWAFIGFLLVLFVAGAMVASGASCFHLLRPQDPKVNKPSVLVLRLEGVIMDGERFLKQLRKYREDDEVKAILVRVNSPGGAVGPSQEIYTEIKRTREEFKKPVVFYASSLVASGAYYSAAGADKLIVNPGTLVGSIGVIMEFANLSDLYKWAKIERYSLNTGPYKDTGADYRAMRSDEKALIQQMLSEVHMQFKKAVSEGRKLHLDKVEKYADGRVMTGEAAVKLGFADQMGTYTDAVKVVGKLANLGDDPEIVEPPKPKRNLMDYLQPEDEEEGVSKFANSIVKLMGLDMSGIPMYLLPSARHSQFYLKSN